MGRIAFGPADIAVYTLNGFNEKFMLFFVAWGRIYCYLLTIVKFG